MPPLVKTTSLGSASMSARDLGARVVDDRFGALAERVHRRGVAELARAARATIVADRVGRERRRRVVVEVDAHHFTW